MATDSHVYYMMTEDEDTIQTVIVSRETTVTAFFELLDSLRTIDKETERWRVLDYKGCLVLPGAYPLPVNSPDTPYSVRVVPKTAFYNDELPEELRMDLDVLERRITEIGNLMPNDDSAPSDCYENLKNDFDCFRKKLENGTLSHKATPIMEMSPAHRKLKYRRLSDSRQKEVWKRFLDICHKTLSEEIMQCLRLPSFDCSEWSDEDILLILQQMFLDFEFISTFNINMVTLRKFLFQVYKNYNEVPFHNFRHSFCVTQMMYAMILRADLRRLMGDLEILVLLTSCICHDLDHPGFNNIYQINARTELAIRYNDISPLENHHCSMAFRILDLPDCNIFENSSTDLFRTIREGIIRSILATDMARHNEILAQFKEYLDDGFDFSNRAHINLLCMVLIKVADISNEARPMNVAEPWLDKLFKEFFAQSDAEKKEGLPITPFMDRDKITKPSSQCSFIGFVLLPLFEALGILFPELDEMIVQPVRDALDYYRRLNEMAKDEQRQQRKSVVTLEACSSNPTSPSSPAPAGNSSSLTPSEQANRMPLQKSQEEVSVSDEAHSLQELDEDEEEGETVTEVAVSEKTLKFKISTESSGSKSHPGSRKGSREKGQDIEISRAYRCERSNRTSDSGADKRSWSSSENTSSAEDKRSDSCTIPERTRHHSMFCPNTSIPECSIEHLTSISAQSSSSNDNKHQKIITSSATSTSAGDGTAVAGTSADCASTSSRTEMEQSKQPSTSTRNSPDLKRLMNRVVRDFRGNRTKIVNGVKNEESTSKDDKNNTSTTANRSQQQQQQKEQKSPSWMSSLLQNMKLKSSHDTDTHN